MPHVVSTLLEGLPIWGRSVRLAEYGGSLDKINDSTENPRSYAAVWYDELRSMRGSAYSRDMSGLVHAENLAIARSEQARTRAADKLTNNQNPRTSAERLGYWIEVQRVTVRQTDTLDSIRLRCAAKYLLASGPTQQNEDDAISDLLGDALVQVYRQEGVDLATPPLQTFWPGVNPGPAAYDLGGGTWLSERAHLVVSVQVPDGMATSDFLELMNVHLFDLLDAMLPAWATFNWAIGVADGFVLDVSQLDFNGMIP